MVLCAGNTGRFLARRDKLQVTGAAIPCLVKAILVIILFSQNVCFAQNSMQPDLAAAAVELTKQDITYDPGYFSIPYPGGDIPAGKGVCTDVIIRAYRKTGIDLQEKVHEDMKSHFEEYPDIWGLKQPDPNIDHRRVPNLMTFFARNGTSLQITGSPDDYLPGDIVCWDLGGGIRHIGIVADLKSSDSSRFLIVHNIGQGQVLEDCIFRFRIIGHYRYPGK